MREKAQARFAHGIFLTVYIGLKNLDLAIDYWLHKVGKIHYAVTPMRFGFIKRCICLSKQLIEKNLGLLTLWCEARNTNAYSDFLVCHMNQT